MDKTKATPEERLGILTSPVMKRADIETLFDVSMTTAQKIFRKAKFEKRVRDTGETETGEVSFNSEQVKTWAVCKAAQINRQEEITVLKSQSIN